MSPRPLLLLALASACPGLLFQRCTALRYFQRQGLRLLEDAENASVDELFGTGDPDLEDLVDLGGVTEQEEEEYRRAKSNRVKLHNTPFKNVLLVVHCKLVGLRIGSTNGNATELCKKRFQLFEPMRQYFPAIVFWTNEDCNRSPLNPHTCLTGLIGQRGEGRDGLLYMHFDALIKPEAMAASFDPNAIGVFKTHGFCSVADGCGWCAWHTFEPQLKQALKNIEGRYALGLDQDHFWLGMDDLFYIPKSVFRIYRDMVPLMGLTHHEIAGPTMWRLISKEKNVPIINLGCAGSCCQEVKGYEALEKGFHCGHPFRLGSKENRDAFARAMLMH